MQDHCFLSCLGHRPPFLSSYLSLVHWKDMFLRKKDNEKLQNCCFVSMKPSYSVGQDMPSLPKRHASRPTPVGWFVYPKADRFPHLRPTSLRHVVWRYQIFLAFRDVKEFGHWSCEAFLINFSSKTSESWSPKNLRKIEYDKRCQPIRYHQRMKEV